MEPSQTSKKKMTIGKKILIGVVVLFVLGLIGSQFDKDKNSNTNNTSSASNSSSETATSTTHAIGIGQTLKTTTNLIAKTPNKNNTITPAVSTNESSINIKINFIYLKLNGGIYADSNLKKFIDFGQVNNNYNQRFCIAFGAHVRKLREEQGIGLRQFALIAEIDYGQISKIERGLGNPTISTLLSLATALNISHEKMLEFKFSEES